MHAQHTTLLQRTALSFTEWCCNRFRNRFSSFFIGPTTHLVLRWPRAKKLRCVMSGDLYGHLTGLRLPIHLLANSSFKKFCVLCGSGQSWWKNIWCRVTSERYIRSSVTFVCGSFKYLSEFRIQFFCCPKYQSKPWILTSMPDFMN